MRVWALVLLLSMIASGCTEDAPDVTPAAAQTEAAERAAAAGLAPTVDENGTLLAPWILAATRPRGFLAGAGIFGDDLVALTDDEHCTLATFVVPEGATAILLRYSGEIVMPETHSAGSQYLIVTPPDGEAFQLDPVLFEGADPMSEPPREKAFEMPSPGEWGVDVDATGAVLGQAWPFTVEITGVSALVPAPLEITCTDS